MDPSLDPRWDRLPHLFAGELPDDEARALQQWIDTAPERRAAVARLRDAWQQAGTPPRAWNVEAALDVIRRRTGGEPGRVIAQVGRRAQTGARPPLLPLPRPRQLPSVIAAAAALTLVAGGGLLWQHRQERAAVPQSAVSFTTFTTRRGERSALRLQDGTLVTLAPATVLRQPSTYGRGERALFLDEGEASFVVTHDAARPFAVHTRRAVARDLGTRFVVRAYAADPTTDVVVAEGVVAVARSQGATATAAPLTADSLVLVRGERVRIGRDSNLEFAREVPLEPYFDWTSGRLSFSDTPLAEVARRLSRWHDVEIRLADTVTVARPLTASFGDEPIADVIRRIASSLDLDVSRVGRAYTLRARLR